MNNQLMGLSWQDAAQLFKTNPDTQKEKLIGGVDGIGFRVDMKPFTDIRVRKALNMAIDRKANIRWLLWRNGKSEPGRFC
jgi:peptide/nickel transport system substrate-binding protein